jgi:hypothetical protein
MSSDGIDVLPPLYAAVLENSTRLLKQHPRGVSVDAIGLAAWMSLTAAERNEELPHVLGSYVTRVHDEEGAKSLTERAVDPTHTYLAEGDKASLWDCATAVPDEHGEVTADRQALLNVLCELELIRHRLDMHEQKDGA